MAADGAPATCLGVVESPIPTAIRQAVGAVSLRDETLEERLRKEKSSEDFKIRLDELSKQREAAGTASTRANWPVDEFLLTTAIRRGNLTLERYGNPQRFQYSYRPCAKPDSCFCATVSFGLREMLVLFSPGGIISAEVKGCDAKILHVDETSVRAWGVLLDKLSRAPLETEAQR